MLDFARHFRRGDTIIEVLFAVTIFSLVAVGGISIMNQGTATSQRSLEITLVRNEIDAQAETLRFLNSSYIASYQAGATGCSPTAILDGVARQWQLMQCEIINSGATKASDFGVTVEATCPSAPSGSLILNSRNATFVGLGGGQIQPAQSFAQVRYDGSNALLSAEGIWVEAVRMETIGGFQGSAGYIDFHIRACWDSPGQSVPVTLGTIVRLYEPRN
jgi:type II secretory pathway pseudopilin PulG